MRADCLASGAIVAEFGVGRKWKRGIWWGEGHTHYLSSLEERRDTSGLGGVGAAWDGWVQERMKGLRHEREADMRVKRGGKEK